MIIAILSDEETSRQIGSESDLSVVSRHKLVRMKLEVDGLYGRKSSCLWTISFQEEGGNSKRGIKCRLQQWDERWQ